MSDRPDSQQHRYQEYRQEIGRALCQASSRKQQAYLALNAAHHANLIGRVFSVALAILIAANALLVFVVFDNGLSPEVHRGIFVFDMVSTAVFAIEYILRIWTADLLYPHMPALKARLRYLVSFMGIIDLLSIAPFIGVVLGMLPYQTFNSLRVLRVVRLVKISRYVKGLNVISRVFIERKHEIFPALAVLSLLILTASVLMYQVENPVQPDRFDSIFTGIYWALTTITTTGYGDLVPVTAAGRLIGIATMLCSIGIVAVPSGILAAGFVEEIRAERKIAEQMRREQQPADGRPSETSGANPADSDSDADSISRNDTEAVRAEQFLYCPYCGKRLH